MVSASTSLTKPVSTTDNERDNWTNYRKGNDGYIKMDGICVILDENGLMIALKLTDEAYLWLLIDAAWYITSIT